MHFKSTKILQFFWLVVALLVGYEYFIYRSWPSDGDLWSEAKELKGEHIQIEAKALTADSEQTECFLVSVSADSDAEICIDVGFANPLVLEVAGDGSVHHFLFWHVSEELDGNLKHSMSCKEVGYSSRDPDLLEYKSGFRRNLINSRNVSRGVGKAWEPNSDAVLVNSLLPEKIQNRIPKLYVVLAR